MGGTGGKINKNPKTTLQSVKLRHEICECFLMGRFQFPAVIRRIFTKRTLFSAGAPGIVLPDSYKV
jgi:hypothetical protein